MREMTGYAYRPAALLLAALALGSSGACLRAAGVLDEPVDDPGFVTHERGALAYTTPATTLNAHEAERFRVGRRMFGDIWVLPTEIIGIWGLGPTFNENSCPACHLHNGRSRAPAHAGEVAGGMLLRMSVPGATREGGPLPHPNYGDQLQNRGTTREVPEEGRAFVRYSEREVRFADGETVTLRVPRIELRGLRFGELGADAMLSPRIAPQMVGLGLLEAVPQETIVALAQGQPGQGVSGRPNYVWDREAGRAALGRFGWKASQPSLRQQVAAAFIGDIGATSSIFPEENCPAVQTACLAGPSASRCSTPGGCDGQYVAELLPSRLYNITVYLQGAAVPARRTPNDQEVVRGEALFAQATCSACHVPTLRTGDTAAIAALANQVIHAYTDLLLHDMGEALADGRPDYAADGREWRTPPLWGIGLLPAVSGHGELLHDGRARNVTEAILWHGGEAEAARAAFVEMPKADRRALVRFVESL
jgi:CxxC motif-containing protein (DUF1111 family)